MMFLKQSVSARAKKAVSFRSKTIMVMVSCFLVFLQKNFWDLGKSPVQRTRCSYLLLHFIEISGE